MPHNDNYLHQLDESQRKAVEYISGPSLVIAGAGSGKTRVLTSKIAYLIDHGLKPWHILALTFTNKAAREMRERIAQIVGENRAKYLEMGTFHSVFAKILRREAPLVGYTPNYTIYDRTDSQSLIKMIVKTMGLDTKVYKPSLVISRISWAKNRLIAPDDYMRQPGILKADGASGIPATGHIYAQYQQRLAAADAMDFDDLLVKMHTLLTTHEEVRRKYVERFEFVLVDEFQDTNHTQAAVLWLLTKERQKLCVVGDDSQSIYAFRGADISNILNFNKTFPGAKLFKLERNYRSTRNIVDAAGSVIAHNQNRIPKDVYSTGGEGEKITVEAAESDMAEAQLVVSEIELDRRQHSYNDMAVLYRRNSQSRVIEEALRKKGVPYRIYGGLSFYQRKEIKDVIAYFRLTVNHNDDEAFRRIVNFPTRGIGATTLDKVVAAATSHNLSLWEATCSLPPSQMGISGAASGRLAKFVDMIEGFSEKAKTEDAYTVGELIIEQSGMKADVVNDITDTSRKENLDELVNALNDFVATTLAANEGDLQAGATLSDYLSEVSLATDADQADANEERVSLMTIHSAKGLEFSTVFLVGVEEEIFPGTQAFYSPREIEEERRLFYVALTRAKEVCHISYAHYRFSYGTVTDSSPSRFISEISPGCVIRKDKSQSPYSADYHTTKKYPSAEPSILARRSLFARRRATAEEPQPEAEKQLSTARTMKGEIVKVGSIVEHKRFGQGEIMSLIDAGDTAKAHINFKENGEKELLLKFAPLSVVKK